jgi:membrane-associated phospholipid phosphatase
MVGLRSRPNLRLLARRARHTADSLLDRIPPSAIALAIYAAFLVGASLIFAWMVEDYVTSDPLVQWDVRFARWLHLHSSQPLSAAFEVVTFAGSGIVLGLLTAGAVALLWRRGERRDAAVVGAVFLGAEILNLGLKLIFQRPRPEFAVNLDTYSFPSGHAMVSAATYGVLVFLICRPLSWKARSGLVAGALTLVLLIDFSRLYLGVHYLSDVIAGTSVGFAWLMLCLLGAELDCVRRGRIKATRAS